ncbi:hypothetical protein JXB27_01175 [Candidatus Woesearchaeota archaeon]|nr:hypothetical protein [Candidatus Woesearchaeota archaeon]
MLQAAQDREVSVRYLDGGFGKRPDILENNSDVIENVKQKASSFHCSEEIWVNPMQISTGMKKDELIKLRKGWDLVLDIDCPIWELSKITTWLFIEALKAHGIKSISLKFSGNKGFHIGVPFKSFPSIVPGKDIPIKDYFPDGPRRIAAYLVNYIEKNLIKTDDNTITFGNKVKYTFDELMKITGKSLSELTHLERNGKRVKSEKVIEKNKYEYMCNLCGHSETKTEYREYIPCSKCSNTFVKPLQTNQINSKKEAGIIERKFDALSVVEVDTILIAPRHLYRMVYSLHEKSGLASIPIDPSRILLFEKTEANPDTLQLSNLVFLDDSKTLHGEAENLLVKAFDFNPIIENEEEERRIKGAFSKELTEQITQKIPEELFPPCIKLLLQPLTDGKKRAMFILLNFMQSVGWNYDEMKERIEAWNKTHPEPLRENLIYTHLNYHKVQNKVLPPNCPNFATAQYYKDMGVCRPDGLCARIKNPVQYAKKRAWILNQELNNSKKGRKKEDKKQQGNRKEKTSKEQQNGISDKLDSRA